MNTIRALATICLTLVLAQKHDIVDAFGNLKNGCMYFLRSSITGEFDGHPYYIDQYTDKVELARQFKSNMVYIARNPHDEADVTQEIKQIELLNTTPNENKVFKKAV